MKLITHNLLMCNRKGCTTNNFPLLLKVVSYKDYDEETAMECTRPLMSRLLEKLDWPALRATVASVSFISCKYDHNLIIEMST